jgi:processive 1,2-diacylglycerol beta-glucosyltransferase
MSQDTVDVLILSTIEGHHSIANSIAHALAQAGLRSHVAICPDRILHVYRFFSRYRPSVLRVFFDLLHVALFRRVIAVRLRAVYSRQLFTLLERHAPRLLVSTNYAFEPSIDAHRSRIPIPYVNVVTDPRTPFVTNLSRIADITCVFDEELAALCRARHPRARTLVTGWFVRPLFTPPPDRGAARERVGLARELFTVLIAAGWEGSNQVLKILPGLLTVHRAVQIVVACGNNERMRGIVESLAVSAAARAGGVRLLALPFTREVHRYMQAADLIVGKAGPNMLFEAVATHTPFFAITHNHGQEDGNLDIIREYGLGFVEENPWRARHLLRGIIEHPESLGRLEAPLRALAGRNAAAGDRIRELALALLARGYTETRRS